MVYRFLYGWRDRMGGSLVWVARSRGIGPKLKKAVAAKMGALDAP